MDSTPARTARRQVRRSAAQWRDLFVRFAQSGQTRERFCAEHNLSLSSFERWRRKLRQGVSTPAMISSEPLFVELTADTAVSATPAWDIELRVGSDVLLRLRRPC
jgi:transposase-like protein